MIELVGATAAHIGTIAVRMRAADRLECAALGVTPRAALRQGLAASDFVITAKVDGRPEAMFGLVVVNALCGHGRPWMLGTDAIYDHPREMLRGGRRIVAAMVDSTPALSNLVSVDNVRAIRFIRRLGFSIREGVIVTAGTEFLEFEMERR